MSDCDDISLPSAVDSDVEDEGHVPAPGPALAPGDQVAFMEVFSNPRIAPYCNELGLLTGPSVDLGTGWDLLLESAQHRLLHMITLLRPLVIMLSPPCTVFSQVQASMESRRKDLAKWARRYEEGKKLWDFAVQLFQVQIRAGRIAVLEHPWLATSWKLDVSQALMGDTAVQSQVFDQCLVGLRTPVSGLPARKRTRLVTNWGGLHQCFSQRCTPETCSHFPATHTWLQGSECGISLTRAAQQYPEAMCRNFASSVHLHCLALNDPVAQDDEEDIDLPSVGFASDPEL